MTQTITACLIIIGNEILSGRTQDKNLTHLAARLNDRGIQLREVRVIPDVEGTIVATVNECRTKFNYIFTTGGIGPTHDDITTASVAKAFGVAVHRHPDAEAALRASYTAADPINEARLKMADVPVGATLIPCTATAAPGFTIGNVYVMAGVPRIMQSMLETILPQLRQGQSLASLSISTDLPEGAIATLLADIQSRHPDVEIGSYPHYSDAGYRTSLVCRSIDTARNDAVLSEISIMIASLGGEVIQ